MRDMAVSNASRHSRYTFCSGSGAGPSPDRMFIGSEGILGIITEAWMRLHEDRRAGADRVVVIATVVRHARVTALRHDALSVLGQAELRKRPMQEPAQVPERGAIAARGGEAVAVPAQRCQLVAHALHGLDRAAGTVADLRQLVLRLGHARHAQHVGLGRVHFECGCALLQVIEHQPAEAERHLTGERNAAGDAQLARDVGHEFSERLGLRIRGFHPLQESALRVR